MNQKRILVLIWVKQATVSIESYSIMEANRVRCNNNENLQLIIWIKKWFVKTVVTRLVMTAVPGTSALNNVE